MYEKHKGIHMEMLLNVSLCARLHSKAKLIKTLEFGTKKGLLQNHARRMGELCPKPSNSCKRFGKAFLKAR